MADEIKPNLEPIEESDLKLKEKFVGGAAKENEAEVKKVSHAKIEEIHSIEGVVEKKVIKAESEAAYGKILSKMSASKATPSIGASVPDDAKQANVGIDAESKIESLVKLAETKGIPHAVRVARHMEDNYALDEFHDRLLGEELHAALVKKGMIKEI